jgi:hypothetical protein
VAGKQKMVEEIKGSVDLQRSLLTKEPLKAKGKKVADEIKGDYKLSLKKEMVATLTYSRAGRVESENLNGVTDFRELVARLLERQGVTWEAAMAGEPVKIDNETRAEAQALIADDGYWGIEQTSERIFEFAVANAGGDVTKLDEIKDAVSKGFEMAKEALGGMLPEISSKTFDAVMAKFDEWADNA